MAFGDFGGGNPFSNIRFGSIMNQGVDDQSMSEFNPALKSPFGPGQGAMGKRFFTNVIPPGPPPVAATPPEPAPLPSRSPFQYNQQEQGGESATQRYFDMLQRISKDRPRQTAYEEAVANVPDTAQYQPSKWRRLASSLAGAATGFAEGAGAGVAAGEHILTSPYRAALQDYEIRTQGLEAGARSEAAQHAEYLKNLELATNYGLKFDELGMESFYKGVTAQQKNRELDISGNKAETDRQQALAQIDRWKAQSQNEEEKNRLDNLRLGIEQGNQQSLAEYRRITGQAAATQAGAAVTSAGASADQAKAAGVRAEAERVRADRYQPFTRIPTIQEQQRARNLVLEELSNNPKFAPNIQVNQDEYGPPYTITNETPQLGREIERRVREKMSLSYGAFGGPGGIENMEAAEEAPEGATDMGDFWLSTLER